MARLAPKPAAMNKSFLFVSLVLALVLVLAGWMGWQLAGLQGEIPPAAIPTVTPAPTTLGMPTLRALQILPTRTTSPARMAAPTKQPLQLITPEVHR